MKISAVEPNQTMPAALPVLNAVKQEPYWQNAAASVGVPGNRNVKQMVAAMQNYINRMNVSLEFSTYGDHGEKIAVIVADKSTGEVIREIPPVEIQNLYAKMSEIAGMIFDGKA